MIFYYIDCLNKAQNDMKWTSNAKLYMELALIKMVDNASKTYKTSKIIVR